MSIIRIVLALLFALTAPAAGYEVDTHREVSRRAVEISTLGSTLDRLFEMDRGAFETVLDRSASKWVEEGSDVEDDLETVRMFNHFHDPLARWIEAGLYRWLGDSSALWAQNQQGAQPDASWFEARRRWWRALTASSPHERENDLSEALLRFGHQIHLIQDAADTAHTRNDAHVAPAGDRELLETHIDEVRRDDFARFRSWLAAPVRPDPALLRRASPNVSAHVPIANLIDTTDADERPTAAKTGLDVGIAEFTNTNFFSADTILDSRYPLPRLSAIGARFRDPMPPPGTTKRRYYRPKVADGPPVTHFIAERSLTPLLQHLPLDGDITFMLDERVVEDYAAILLPRAVGYSAAWIDYFLRGDVAIVGDGRNGRYEIENRSAEEMDGTFDVYYDDVDDLRRRVGGVATRQGRPLAPGARLAVTLSSPIDPPKRPGRYLVVFRGRLGLEGKANDEAAAAVVAGISHVPAEPGIDAGIPHTVMLETPHAHRGATATDVNGDLSSYRWSFASCPGPCPPLSAASGSLSGGFDPVTIPPPSYVPNAYGEHRLRLEVFDASGRANAAEIGETTATYMVPGYDENGERLLFPEPSVTTAGHHEFAAGTRHVHVVSARSDYGEPFDFLFSWIVCRDLGGDDDCDQAVDTNFAEDGSPLRGRFTLRPGVSESMEFGFTPTIPGRYYVSLQWTAIWPGNPTQGKFIGAEEIVR